MRDGVTSNAHAPRRAKPGTSQLVSRVLASIVGGWAFTWGCVCLGIALLLTAGMPYGDARTLADLLAFLVYLAAVCWSFAAASAARIWATLGGGGALMTALAWWITRPHG